MKRFDCTLRQYINGLPNRSAMPLDQTIAKFQQLAGAIDSVHERGGVVHGNLKPNTIVLDTESKLEVHPYISDFGAAALGLERVGTLIYASPEQFFGSRCPSV